ncbi:MAG: methyltransferase domain-containing protein [Thermomonas sp.]
MPLPAFRRQPEPALAAAWFAGVAGQAVIASEAELLRLACRERPGQPGLWLQPGVMDLEEADCWDIAGLRLHAAGDGFGGDVRCGTTLPLASDSCGVVVVQHLADISAAPADLLAECARVLVPGGRLWLLALNPLAPYRLRWSRQGPRAAEPVTWRRRLRAVGLAPEPVSQGLGPTWTVSANPRVQDGAGLRSAFVLRAEKRRTPLTPTRATPKLRLQPALPAA